MTSYPLAIRVASVVAFLGLGSSTYEFHASISLCALSKGRAQCSVGLVVFLLLSTLQSTNELVFSCSYFALEVRG